MTRRRTTIPALLVLLVATTPAFAGPRDELLRVAPQDAALIVVVQNARAHSQNIAESEFGKWFPSTSVGKKLLGSVELKQLKEVANSVLPALGTTPEAVLNDVIGDAVAFAYSPGQAGSPGNERAVILVRPSKPETLAKILDKLNDIQKTSGELKSIARREHAGAEYFERQKPDNGNSEFYCFRDGVFAFSTSEADIKAVLDRARNEPKDKPPELVTRMQKLGVADAAVVILVNPRKLDAEVKAKLASAKADEQRFLSRLAEVWAGLEAVAVSVSLDRDLEFGLSVRFTPDKLPADLKPWLIGPRKWGNAAAIIPQDALFGFAGHAKASELLDLVATLVPMPPGKPGVKEWMSQTVGSVVDRDKLPLLLDSLGPNWAAWAEPPAKDATLPTLVAAVEISGDEKTRAEAEKSLLEAARFGFQTVRFAYNAKHPNGPQIQFKEEKHASGVVITSLVNEKGFPPGFRPSFAVTRGYLVLATNPEAIQRFRPSALNTVPTKAEATLARLSGTQTRAYLQTHGDKLAKFLSGVGAGDEKTLQGHIEGLASVLELIEVVELTGRDIENGLRLSVRVKPAKPLKR